MKNLIISIDLAIRQSGFVVRENGEFRNMGFWHLEKWENTPNFFKYLHSRINSYILLLKKEFNDKYESVDLVYELANFSNPLQTQRMAYIAGVVCEVVRSFYSNVNIYTFNANKWYYYFNKEYCGIQNWNKLPREKRKEFSINHFIKEQSCIKSKLPFLTQSELSDVADAYWIGKYYKEISNEPTNTKSNGLKKRKINRN